MTGVEFKRLAGKPRPVAAIRIVEDRTFMHGHASAFASVSPLDYEPVQANILLVHSPLSSTARARTRSG